MTRTRVALVLGGMALPYVARIPGTLVHGLSWLTQYTSGGIAGFSGIETANFIALGPLVLVSYFVRRPIVLALPAVLGLGFVGYAHASIDLGADAQAAVALFFIPIYALPLVLGGFVVSFAVFGLGRKPRGAAQRARKRAWLMSVTTDKSLACPACGAPVNFGASHCQHCEQAFSYDEHERRRGTN